MSEKGRPNPPEPAASLEPATRALLMRHLPAALWATDRELRVTALEGRLNMAFAGRRSNGSARLGAIVEGAVDWTVSRHLSVNGYVSRMGGGPVVAGTFAGTRLVYGYVETAVSF